MSDKKNFSVFNKLDEKYVEEADAYSASPKVEKKRRKDERAARKAKIKSQPPAQHFHKRSRRVAKRIAQIAACFLIKSRHEAPSDGANESSCPESAKDSADVEGGGDDDSQDGAASESASVSENSGEAEEGQSPSSGPDNESASDSVPDSSSSASDSTDSASEE